MTGDPQLGQAGLECFPLTDQRADVGQYGHPKPQAAINAPVQVFQAHVIFTFRRAPPELADQPRQLAVGGPVGRQQHQMNAFLEMKLGADDEVNVVIFGGQVRLDQAGKGALVGDGDGLVAEPGCLLYQFLRV